MSSKIANLWDDARAASMNEQELLLYRSNLLGSDMRITNFGGGNTSAKVTMTDPLSGEDVQVLWVKGSGGDLGSMKLDGFSTLYMSKLSAIKKLYRGIEYEDEMVGLLPHCTFNLNPRAASIDTPLHAYLPYIHVDHMHPDALIAIAASERSQELTRECFGDIIGWLPWQRPGYELGLQLADLANKKPHLKGVVLGGHGLFTWDDDAKNCYELTLSIIQKAQDWLDQQRNGSAFGGECVAVLADKSRDEALHRLLPQIRGKIGQDERKIAHVAQSHEVLEFVNSIKLNELAALGTSCPDHFLRTKIRPLVLPAKIDEAGLNASLEAYRADYAGYYERCKHPDSPALRDPNPVIYLVPGVGMLSFAKDKATARIAAEFYTNAINVMRGASSIDHYVGLSEQEAFNIEYWLLEEAKLQRMPKPKSLAGRVAVISGGAGGIGRATARALLSEGACVMLTDRDAEPLTQAYEAFADEFKADVVRQYCGDVTQEAAMSELLAQTVREFGGVDIVVANAGLASAASFEETTSADWDLNSAVLAKGAFLLAREAFKIMKAQMLGGSIITIGSKNALAASAGASAYCSAKAAVLHLTRCIALEGAPVGIRANTVNPDAVLKGSRIWQGDWRKSRESSYGVEGDALDEVYRKRSLLKKSVLPQDIAQAVYFFACDASSKSTGNIINVDAGNAGAFTR